MVNKLWRPIAEMIDGAGTIQSRDGTTESQKRKKSAFVGFSAGESFQKQ